MTAAYDQQQLILSPCASHDDDEMEKSPLSPPRPAKEGIEIIMPVSPTSTIMADVFLLMEDDQVQRIKRNDDSCLYLSDASMSETASFCSTLNSTLIGSPFLLELEPEPNTQIPQTVFQTHHQKPSSNSTIGNSSRSGRGTAASDIQYNYSEDEEEQEEEEKEQEVELLGLSCLPDAMLCAPLSGFLEEDTWDTFWGSACGTDNCKQRLGESRHGFLATTS